MVRECWDPGGARGWNDRHWREHQQGERCHSRHFRPKEEVAMRRHAIPTLVPDRVSFDVAYAGALRFPWRGASCRPLGWPIMRGSASRRQADSKFARGKTTSRDAFDSEVHAHGDDCGREENNHRHQPIVFEQQHERTLEHVRRPGAIGGESELKRLESAGAGNCHTAVDRSRPCGCERRCRRRAIVITGNDRHHRTVGPKR